MLLLDASGNEIFRRSFGTESYDIGYSACPDYNDGYMLSGMVTNLSKQAIYHFNASGIILSNSVISTTAGSMAAIIKKDADGLYDVIVQTSTRIYFYKMAGDYKIEKTSIFENPFGGAVTFDLHDVYKLGDGSFSFLYYDDGPVIVKTIPLNQIF